MLCVVAMLRSRLMRAAGQWQQHKACMILPRSRTLLSRANTTAAELYYLRHMRSCAAAAMGNKGGNRSPSVALQLSGADFIGRLLQSIWRHCHLTVFASLDRLLQSMGEMVRYHARIAMKVIIVPFAMPRDMLTWSTPLEFAACLHLANGYIHQDLCAYYSEFNHCQISAVNALSVQEIATTVLALLILILSIQTGMSRDAFAVNNCYAGS